MSSITPAKRLNEGESPTKRARIPLPQFNHLTALVFENIAQNLDITSLGNVVCVSRHIGAKPLNGHLLLMKEALRQFKKDILEIDPSLNATLAAIRLPILLPASTKNYIQERAQCAERLMLALSNSDLLYANHQFTRLDHFKRVPLFRSALVMGLIYKQAVENRRYPTPHCILGDFGLQTTGNIIAANSFQKTHFNEYELLVHKGFAQAASELGNMRLASDSSAVDAIIEAVICHASIETALVEVAAQEENDDHTLRRYCQIITRIILGEKTWLDIGQYEPLFYECCLDVVSDSSGTNRPFIISMLRELAENLASDEENKEEHFFNFIQQFSIHFSSDSSTGSAVIFFEQLIDLVKLNIIEDTYPCAFLDFNCEKWQIIADYEQFFDLYDSDSTLAFTQFLSHYINKFHCDSDHVDSMYALILSCWAYSQENNYRFDPLVKLIWGHLSPDQRKAVLRAFELLVNRDIHLVRFNKTHIRVFQTSCDLFYAENQAEAFHQILENFLKMEADHPQAVEKLCLTIIDKCIEHQDFDRARTLVESLPHPRLQARKKRIIALAEANRDNQHLASASV